MNFTVNPDVLAGGGKSAGFDQPFEMMEACHERLHRMLALMARLKAHMAEHGVDEEARQAARDIIRYFDQAAPQHHRDEELHVFPPIFARGDDDAASVAGQLLQEHAAIEAQWKRVREVLQGVADVTIERLTPADIEEFDAFAGINASHAETEERIAYPAARPLIDAATQRAMGQEMHRRRNG
ncbi:MAG TPA: hemerythrin domain-containing protein [Ramlibacter sp.]|uniref:hemerythrin domain-containing protein n=1 Tax=Ramlibacter sp. TaxID=1917967 RepID=UPI002CE856B3|nr:hemerythrin domain-containing protein [Ramlibacter sp.]HVZ43428.1 hemerythrin domain-containing protein [Ramlibacter sp.]